MLASKSGRFAIVVVVVVVVLVPAFRVLRFTVDSHFR